MLPNDLIDFVPEISDYPTSVVETLYQIALEKYPDETDKILRYYYLGFLLTTGEEGDTTEVKISNVSIKGKGEGNYYYSKWLSLLKQLKPSEASKLQKRVKVVILKGV